MYNVDDLIIYGDMGVCKVINITTPDFIKTKKDQLYYVLQSLYQKCVIYMPVDTATFMRPILSAKEVDHLIDMIPAVQTEVNHNSNIQQGAASRETAVNMHDCADLIKYVMVIDAKKQYAEQQKRKLGMVDEKSMKQAEGLLYGEFSLALGIPVNKVQDYIASRVNAINEKQKKENDKCVS